ncbi:MAG: translocation/assembly module TamB domain-containing protein [Parasphingorhabdus sp.]
MADVDTKEPASKSTVMRTIWTSLLAIIVILSIGTVGAAYWLDSDSGHNFIVEQVEGLQPEDGLRIKIGELEGSIFNSTKIKDLELSDPNGTFFTAGETTLNWNPLAWVFNELNISSAAISKARLERLPTLIPSTEETPLLPSFDIYVGTFRADNLSIGAAVTGEEQFADLAGALDITSGRAMLNLDAATTKSGDKVKLIFNAEPERGKLELRADVAAPVGGAIANYLGLTEAVNVTVNGDGDWDRWDGQFAVERNDQIAARTFIAGRGGVFGINSTVENSVLPAGIARRIAAPQLAINGTMIYDNGIAGVDLVAESRAISLSANGGINLTKNALDAMRIEAKLENPSALLANMKAQNLELRALLNGSFSELRYQYLATTAQIAFGKSLFMGVQAEGKGQRDPGGWDIPIALTADQLIGNGELAKRLASGFQSKANFRFEQGLLFADNSLFQTDSLKGKADIELRPATGNYAVLVDAQAPGFLINGLGIADILASVNLRPGANGLALSGDVSAKFRRFDNSFLRELGGGVPEVTSGLSLGSGNLLQFQNIRISAPKLRFSGSGDQINATEFAFNGTGKHDQYGSFDLALDGPLNRPQIALVLDSPLPAAGLSKVRVALAPIANGFSYQASGGSTLGPFDSEGAIVTGEETLVRVNRLLVSETMATGIIRPTSAGLAGSLNISGGGVNGSVRFEPGSNRQVIRANLVAKNARFVGNPPIFIRTGKLNADVILVDGKSDINATLQAQGISRGELMVGRIAGNAKLNNGTGTAVFSIAGTRGSTFEFQARANIKPNRYVLTGNGLFEGRRLRLSKPLDLRRVSDGWAAAPTTISYGSGSTRLSGRWGSGRSSLNLNMSKMPLSLMDIAFNDLELGGFASGTVKLSQTNSQTPIGDAKLTIKGLTRSGLILTSRPVDLGLNIAISNRNAAARGIIQSNAGKTIGRFQGRVTGLGRGDWKTELLRNPLFAQARFNGEAESLWRLTGVETFDLTGPVALSADVAGTLENPQIEGQFRTASARLESGLTGTVVTGIKANGQFDGSRLILPNITGNTKGGGTVSGSGSFNFAVEPNEGIGIVMDVNASKAALIARDDFAATITGPIKIRSSKDGGLISGDVVLNRSFFRFGQASAVAALPQINTREINRRADERPRQIRSRPWRFAINADAPNRLMVDGLGLDSEWRANLKVSGPVDNFALTGNANLVRGNYTFAGRRFSLERGRIRFVGNQPVNPVLDIEAEANLTGLNATINVTGTGNRPEIAFNSIPALPEDELLSRILFGASIADLSAPEAVQLAAAVASLNNGGGLDPINQLRKAVGLDRLRILPSDINSGQGTSIAAGKYITRRAYVELITDGKGYSATRLEFQITRWLSILSSISTLGRQSANVRVSRDY